MSQGNDKAGKAEETGRQKPPRATPPIPPKPAVPQPAAAKFKVEAERKQAEREAKEGTPETKKTEPTRYGDWEKNGRCIDF